MASPQLTRYVQGQGAVGADSLNTFVQTCVNVAQLRGFAGVSNMLVEMQGTATAGDGGQGTFYWNATSTAPDDGTNIIRPNGVARGAWIRLVGVSGGSATFRQFGAIGNGVADDTAAMVAAFAALNAGTVKGLSGTPGDIYRYDAAVGLTIAIDNVQVLSNGSIFAPYTNRSDKYGLQVNYSTYIQNTTLAGNTQVGVAGCDTIQVNNAGSAAPGQMFHIRWADPANVAQDPSSSLYGHTCRIRAVSGNNITLDVPIPYAINSSWNNHIDIVIPRVGVVLDLDMDMSNMGTKRPITAISKASPPVISVASTAGLVSGDRSTTIILLTTTTMYQIHGAVAAMASLTATTFTLPGYDTSSATTYVVGTGWTRVITTGVFFQFIDSCTLHVRVKNADGGGAGFSGFYAYACDLSSVTDTCGNQIAADTQLYYVTGGLCRVRSTDSTGFGPEVTGCSNITMFVDQVNCPLTGRGFKTGSTLNSTFHLPTESNAGATNLSITWGTKNCTFVGGNFSGPGPTNPVQQNGIWFSSCYNTGNIFVAVTSLNNPGGYDVQINATDTNNWFIGCRVSNIQDNSAGPNLFLDPNRIQGNGPNVAQLTDRTNGYPLGLGGSAGGANRTVYIGSVTGDGVMDFTAAGMSSPTMSLAYGDPAAAATAMLLRVHNTAGVSVQAVTLGTPDSGGSGFRALRVPN